MIISCPYCLKEFDNTFPNYEDICPVCYLKQQANPNKERGILMKIDGEAYE